jgi:hypothetical protein
MRNDFFRGMDVERQFNTMFKYVGILWVVSAIMSLALVAAVIWGIIELVQWVTAQ